MESVRRVAVTVAFLLSIPIAGEARAADSPVPAMNKKLKEGWTATKCRLFLKDESAPTTIRGKIAQAEIEVEKDGWTTIPVTAFVSPSGKVWIGPQQDFYLEVDSAVIGIQMEEAGQLLWSTTLAKGANAHAPASADPSLVFDSISGAAVYDSRFGLDPDEHARRITDLRTVIDSSFFAKAPGSSESGRAKITAASFEKGHLRLDLTDESAAYSASVRVDLKTRKPSLEKEVRKINP